MATNWNSDLSDIWSGVSLEVTIAHPVFLRAVVGSPDVADALFYQLDSPSGTKEEHDFFLERQGLVLESSGIHPSEMKLITCFYPILTGIPGTVVQFWIGGQQGQPTSEVTYDGPYNFTIGTTTKIDCLFTCRYPAYKLFVTTAYEVILEAIGFEFETVGED